MTVRELIHHLSTCADPDAVVILQRDAEGNGFSPMRDFATNDPALVERYIADTTWSGEVQSTSETDDGVPCVVFAPVN